VVIGEHMIIEDERIVKIKATDWVIWEENIDLEDEFKPYTGWLIGQVVMETDEYITIASELSKNNKVKKAISIPKGAVIEIIEFRRN